MTATASKWVLAVCSALLLALTGCAVIGTAAGRAPAMAVSVASDGRYAVSSHEDNELVLWDIERRTSRVLATDANVYSARFVPQRELILWQGLDDEVRISRLDGSVVEHFSAPPAYSHAISADLQTYLASDEGWRLWLRKGKADLEQLKAGDSGSFFGLGKPLNIAMSVDGRHAVTAGFGAYYHRDGLNVDAEAANGYERFDGVALWDLETKKPLFNFPGNAAKTHAALSPDGEYVVSGDEDAHTYRWTTGSGKRQRYAGLWSGVFQPPKDPTDWDDLGSYDDSRMIPAPSDVDKDAVIAMAFVDTGHFVRIYTNSHHATLFSVESPWPIKHFDLGTDPYPATNDYPRDAAVDSAPAANLLVTGQRSGGGINVYRFDPEAQTLLRIWAPSP